MTAKPNPEDAARIAQLRTLIAHEPELWEMAAPQVGPGASEVPAFPLDAFPSLVRAYIEAAVGSLGVPPEMVAVPFLGITAALIGNRLHIALKASWREYPSLYLAVVAPPGSAKTPALSLAKWPLDALQQAAYVVYTQRIAAYGDELEAWKQSGEKCGEAKPVPPDLRHFYSTDLTVEALASMLEKVPGLAIIRDEISGWVAALDQYKGGKGADRQQYLSMWSGQSLKVDRKSGGSVFVAAPVVSVVGGIQPDLAAMLHDPAKRRDGFVERILPVVPDVGPARWTDTEPGAELFQAVHDVFAALDALPRPAYDADRTQARDGEIMLDPEARALWVSWVNENSDLTAAVAGLAAGFYSKLPAHVARLALILHALWHPTDPPVLLAAERMRDAIELGEFFRAHIGRFLALLNTPAPAGTAGVEVRIVRILRSANDPAGWVARSEIYRRLRNVTAEALSATLERMADNGTIERRSVASATKPQEQYRICSSRISQFPAAASAETLAGARNGEETANNENCESPGNLDQDTSAPPAVPGRKEVVL